MFLLEILYIYNTLNLKGFFSFSTFNIILFLFILLFAFVFRKNILEVDLFLGTGTTVAFFILTIYCGKSVLGYVRKFRLNIKKIYRFQVYRVIYSYFLSNYFMKLYFSYNKKNQYKYYPIILNIFYVFLWLKIISFPCLSLTNQCLNIVIISDMITNSFLYNTLLSYYVQSL